MEGRWGRPLICYFFTFHPRWVSYRENELGLILPLINKQEGRWLLWMSQVTDVSQAEFCLYSVCLELTVQGTRTTVHFIHCLPSPTQPHSDLIRKGLPSIRSEPTTVTPKDLFKAKILSFALSPHLPDKAVDHLSMKYRGTIFYLCFRKKGAGVQPLLNVI